MYPVRNTQVNSQRTDTLQIEFVARIAGADLPTYHDQMHREIGLDQVRGAAQAILERGCNDFIQKPFTIEQLSQKIGAVIGESVLG